MKKIVSFILFLLFSFSFISVALAEDINKISIDKLVDTINSGNVTKKIKELSGTSDLSIVASKVSEGLEISIENSDGWVGISDGSYLAYDSSSNTITYTCYDDCSLTADELPDDFKYTEKDILNYLELWIYESSSYADSKKYSSLSTFKYFFDSKLCDLTNAGACVKTNADDEDAYDFTYELSDKIAVYLNKDESGSSSGSGSSTGGGSATGSGTSTGSGSSSSSGTSTGSESKTGSESSSSGSSSSSESTETKKINEDDVKNPKTGAFLNYGIAVLLTASAIGIIYIIRKKSKFYRI